MNDIRSFFSSTSVNIAMSTAVVYGVTYLGRVYLQINPLHAALFSLGNYITAELAFTVARKIINNRARAENGEISEKTLRVGRVAYYVIQQMPMTVALASGAYSLLQTITAYGLANLCAFHYLFFTGQLSIDQSSIDKIVDEVDEVVEVDADRMKPEIDADGVDASRISIVSLV